MTDVTTPGKPKKTQITLRIDADVVAFFRATGKGWQGRMNDQLRLGLPGSEITQDPEFSGIRIVRDLAMPPNAMRMEPVILRAEQPVAVEHSSVTGALDAMFAGVRASTQSRILSPGRANPKARVK